MHERTRRASASIFQICIVVVVVVVVVIDTYSQNIASIIPLRERMRAAEYNNNNNEEFEENLNYT